MIQVETGLEIQCPVEAVFSFVSDVGNSAKWKMRAPLTLESAAGSAAQTRRRRVWSPGQLPTWGLDEVTVFETNRKLGIRTCFGPFEFDAVYYFEPAGAGTRITWTCRVRADDPYQFAEALMGQLVSLEAEAGLVILKSLLEAEPATI